MFVQKFLPLAFDQQIARTGFHEHSKSAARLDQFFADQLLVSFQNRERIDPILGRDIADRRKRIAFFENAVENHVNDPVAELAINRLTIIPLTRHFVLQILLGTAACSRVSTGLCLSYSDLLNYNTIAEASSFLQIFL